MKNLKTRSAVLFLSTLCLLTSAYGQLTPSADSYTNTADPTTNYGAKPLLDVDAATQTTYIQFNMSSIPTGASVSQATLKLYVNAVTRAGSFNVDYVNGTWSESTITSNLAPALGSVIAASVPITTADKNQYVLINVTPALVAWLNGSQANDGIALVANGRFNASFDSKENTTTSHPAELDIVFAGGGTITGVATDGGSGLIGGGTSGALNLSLTNTCATNQVLQWNGSSWVCASAGAGTITGVTAGTDLTGGGSSGTVPLNLDTTKVPQLATANTFTGNQTINGNLSATGVVTGSSFQIGSNLFAFGTFANENVFLGFAGNTTMTNGVNTAIGFLALQANTTGGANTASGALALASNTTGEQNTASGAIALSSNTTGGSNTASGDSALSKNTTGNQNTAIGNFAAYTVDGSSVTGNYNTAVGSNAWLGTGSISNATAIGANAVVSESNALVLGCIAGVNNCASNVNVGIGTTTPGVRAEIANGGTPYNLYLSGYAPSLYFGGVSGIFPNGGNLQTSAGYMAFATNAGSYYGQVGDLILATQSWQAGNSNAIRFMTPTDDTGQYGPVMSILRNGNVGIGTATPSTSLDVVGALKLEGSGNGITFPDGSTQTTAGGQGAQGPPGPTGPTGPAGPPGPAVHTFAACSSDLAGTPPGCGCTHVLKSTGVAGGASCTVTADSGSCTAVSTGGLNGDTSGECCVCSP